MGIAASVESTEKWRYLGLMRVMRALAWVAIALGWGCGRRSDRVDPGAPASAAPALSTSAVAPPETPEPHALAGAEPTVLLTLPISAYAPVLFADEGVVYLLTSKAAYRIVPGHQPEQFPLDLGIGPTMTASSFVFWSKGAIWQAPKAGGKPRRIVSLSHEPQRFVTSGDRFAWLDRTDEGKFTIQTLARGKPKTIWSARGDIDVVTMLQDWVFFVERDAANAWRFGGVRVAGGEPTFSAPHSGRTPAMLVPYHDHLYYYDSNTIEIHRLSPDFLTNEILSKEFICSPLAVSTQIYCAHVAGLFEVSGRPLSSPVRLTERRVIPAIAASSELVTWLSDTGPDQLALEMLPVLLPDAGPARQAE